MEKNRIIKSLQDKRADLKINKAVRDIVFADLGEELKVAKIMSLIEANNNNLPSIIKESVAGTKFASYESVVEAFVKEYEVRIKEANDSIKTGRWK